MFIAIFAFGGIVVGLLVHFKTFQFTFQFNFQSAAPEIGFYFDRKHLFS